MPGAIAQEPSRAKPGVIGITVRENGRLLVPVAVNGKKESRFLFDTGATTTVLSERLAAKAGVTAKSVKRVGTFAGEVTLPVGQVDTLRVDNHAVGGLDVLIGDLGRLFNLDAEIEGILGQDFLSRFNYHIDPRRGQLEIEEDGNLSSKLSGTRVACEKRGGKIYVPAAGGDVRLILDSGNPYLVVYEDAASRLQPAANIKEKKVVRSPIGSRAIRPFRIESLEIGDSQVRNVDAFLATRGPGRSEDGFLPLYLFDSIYVNNLENFLIANPQRDVVRVPSAVSLGQIVEERSDARSAEVVQIGSCRPTVAPEVALAALGFFNRGVSRAEKGDHDGAIENYSSAVRQDPCLAIAYHNRGNALRLKGKLAEAIADFNRAVAINPLLAEAYNNRGLVRRQRADLEGAFADYAKAIELRPRYAAAYNNRGNVRHDKRDFTAAISDFDKAIAIDPQFALAYSNRGQVRQEKGEMLGALDDYNQAIELDPTLYQAYNNRGSLRFALADTVGAIEDLDRAIALRPGYAMAYLNRGLVRLAQRKGREAESDFSQCLKFDRSLAPLIQKLSDAVLRRLDAGTKTY